MKILLKILLIILPLALIINLYRFAFTSTEYEFFGIHAFADALSTFNGLSNTLNTINEVSSLASSIGSTGDFWTNVVDFFKMIGLCFQVPIKIIVDICLNIGWFIAILTGQI